MLYYLSLVYLPIYFPLYSLMFLLVDEAHKATGNYAYAQIVRWLMATNGHFRVLALTATPGSKPEAVQDIIDSLHISNVEIRDENSIDLQKYMLPKVEMDCITTSA